MSIAKAALSKTPGEQNMGLINQYTLRELTPDEVYCFRLCICDNENDRDDERFSVKTLEELAGMFPGKPMLIDHQWSAEKQTARFYEAWVEASATEKTSYGAPLVRLMGAAYIPISEETRPVIDAIEAGILKEVSVGCSVAEKSCSLCGGKFRLDMSIWDYACSKDHVKGMQYDEGLCVAVLDGAVDAYEVSFVAVPAQPGAGITKGENEGEAVSRAFALLLNTELSDYEPEAVRLARHIRKCAMSAQEKAYVASELRYIRSL